MNDPTDDAPDGPSKTRLKREMAERQALGEALTRLSEGQLASFPLEDSLREALADYRRFKHREAKRRQLQFIGRLLREVDIEPIQQALDMSQAGSVAAKQRHHKLEYWRDRLLTEGNPAVEALLEEYPGVDRQQVRQLIRQASKEAENNKPPAASRKLFKYLREHCDG